MELKIPTFGVRGRRRDRHGTRRRSAMVVISALVTGLVSATGALVIADPAAATYAQEGAGRYVGAIDWIEWGESGAPITNGTTATSSRQIADQQLTTTCTITDVEGSVAAYRSGDYSGDSLDNLYNIGGANGANQMVYGLVNRVQGKKVSFHFACGTTLTDTVTGASQSVPLAGLVVADAESSNRSQGEYVQAKPDEADAKWRIIDRARSCDTNVLATLSADKTLRLHPDAEQCSSRQSNGNGPMAIGYMDGATGAAVTVQGGGKSAVALGVVLEADFGDAPESYGAAGALFEREWIGGEVPVATENVSTEAFPLATQGQPRTSLGALTDADYGQQTSANADKDDLTGQDDEDAVGRLGEIAVTPGQQYTLDDVACTGPGYVAGWMDWNRNGTFDEGEGSAAVDCAGAAVDLTWTVPMDAEDGASFLRLRIAQREAEEAEKAKVASPVGMTTSGEVEDHAVTIALPHLAIEKTSDATVDTRPGDTVTYTLRARNAGATDYTDAYPAVVLDDMSGVLDDARYAADASADRPGELAYAEPILSWTGALASNDAVEITYTTVVKAGGDGTARNVAWEPEDPENAVTPSCDPAHGGADPTSGEPCAEALHLLPKLQIEKTALTDALPAVGETAAFRIELTNVGPGAFTSDHPASVTDDLVDVLDDATFDSATADIGPEPAFDGDRFLTWQGALAAGETVTLDYTVTYTGTGDNVLRNTACIAESDTAADASSCDVAQIPAANLSWWKQVEASDEPAVAGSTLDYTLWFTNDGEADATVDTVDFLTHVLDDADVTIEPSSEALTATRDGERISITGSVAPGATVSVTYQVTVRGDDARGDDIAANFLLPAGEEPPTTPVCEPDQTRFPDCTSTPIAAVSYAKSVTASTDPVAEGTVLTYEITIKGTGEAAAAVSREDDLAGVLDDAELSSAPTSDTDSVTVSEVADDRFAIGGTIDAGETATVTYQVTVKAAAERGNHQADNFLVLPGEAPPAECEESTQCTSTTMPAISAAKSSDPATGETVTAGGHVTYTLTFRNDGTAAGAVDYIDDLSDVLDDATLVEGPSSDVLEATLEDSALHVSGSLAADRVATVTYTVEVGADGTRGDNRLVNVLAPSEVENPSCGDALVSCTEHPVPELTSWKSVEASETPVAAGTELTYTLHFENTGEAAATVDETDSLAHVLDDADLTEEPSGGALTAIRDDDTITVTGTVAPHSVEIVTYTVTVKADGERGDDIAANFLLPTGEEPPAGPVCQPTDADQPACTVTPIGRIIGEKTADPASGTVVDAGEHVTYTLSFANEGQAETSVDWTDSLADVLDDAVLVEAPSSDALTTVIDGSTLRVTGVLIPGAAASVTYTVEARPYDEQGDHVLGNVLARAGEEPPITCDPDTRLCTEHPTRTPTPEPTPEPSPADPSPTPEPTPEPTQTPEPTETPEPAPEPSDAPTPEPVESPEPEPTTPPVPEQTTPAAPEPTEHPTPTDPPAPKPDGLEAPTPSPAADPEPTEPPAPVPGPDEEAAAPSEVPAPAPAPSETPDDSGALSATGTSMTLGALLVALVALLGGAGLLAARRRQEHGAA